jgi:hypothetical protein
MASLVTEEQLINLLARHMSEVDGIRNAYAFARNPDALPVDMLPATVFFPSMGTQSRKAHFNRWTNIIEITGLLMVTTRMQKGGTIKYIDNTVLPFPQKIRQKFQTASVIQEYLALGCQVADFKSWRYTSGGLLLYMDVQYVGLVLQWEFHHTA